jgi:4-hydroxy-tetrahydrodipicolinate synthase
MRGLGVPAGPTGIICPIITPLTEEEELDETALNRQIDRLVGNVDGVLMLGTTGELPLVSPPVADRLVETIRLRAGQALTLVLGIGDAGTSRARRNMARIGPGVDFVAACSPYYFPYTDDDLLRYYGDLADSSPVPLVLYNIPQNTHIPLSRALVEQCAMHGNIVGIKDSSGDAERFRDLLSLSRPDFTVLQGTDERNAAQYFDWGCAGYVSGLENITPGLLRALSEQDPAAQRRLDLVARVPDQGFWLSAIKYAVARYTGGTGRIAAPLPALTEDQAERVDRLLDALEGA